MSALRHCGLRIADCGLTALRSPQSVIHKPQFSRGSTGAVRPAVLLTLLCSVVVLAAWLLMSGVGKTSAASNSSTSTNKVATPAKSPSGWYSIGKQGDELGDFQQPRGITCMDDGSFVVVDRAARVQHFS